MLTRLRPGLVSFTNEFEAEQKLFISSGFVEVQPHIVTVLADTVTRTKNLGEAAALAAMVRTQKSNCGQASAADCDKLMTELKMEIALLRAIDQMRKQSKR